MENYIVGDRLVSVNVLETCEVFDRHFRNMEVSLGEDGRRELALYDLSGYAFPDKLRSRLGESRYRPISIDTFLNLLEPKKNGRVSRKLNGGRVGANIAFARNASGAIFPVCCRRVSKNEELRNLQSPFIEVPWQRHVPGWDESHWRMEIIADCSQWWSYARLVASW